MWVSKYNVSRKIAVIASGIELEGGQSGVDDGMKNEMAEIKQHRELGDHGTGSGNQSLPVGKIYIWNVPGARGLFNDTWGTIRKDEASCLSFGWCLFKFRSRKENHGPLRRRHFCALSV